MKRDFPWWSSDSDSSVSLQEAGTIPGLEVSHRERQPKRKKKKKRWGWRLGESGEEHPEKWKL